MKESNRDQKGVVYQWLNSCKELGLRELFLSPGSLTEFNRLSSSKAKVSLPLRDPILKGTSDFTKGEKGLDLVRKELGECMRCRLSQARTKLVFGEGNPQASLMFIGEGPGREEDLQGRPFVGRAGQLLTKIIEAIELKREEVYIANVVKSRPPENRAPLPDEIAECLPFLMKQIAAIEPKVIVALGKTAASILLQTEEPITKIRGRIHRLNGIRVMPTFHPAYLLRNPAMKRYVWEDMKLVKKELDKGMKDEE